MEGAESLIVIGMFIVSVVVGIAEICGIFAPDPVEEIEEVDPNVFGWRLSRDAEICLEPDGEILSYLEVCEMDGVTNIFYIRYLLEKEYRGL